MKEKERERAKEVARGRVCERGTFVPACAAVEMGADFPSRVKERSMRKDNRRE